MPNSVLSYLSYLGIVVLAMIPWVVHYFLLGGFSFRTLIATTINSLLILILGIPLVRLLLEKEERKKEQETVPAQGGLEELSTNPLDAGVIASAGLLLKFLLTKNKKIIEDQRKELDKMLIQDPLTSMYNSFYFHQRMEEEIYKSQRQKYVLNLMMVQMDRFAEYRQAFGPKAGDEMVKYVAKLLHQCTRDKIDMLFRYGDTVFAVALPNTPSEGAQVVARRMLQTVYDKTRRITLSAGLLTIDGHSYSEAVTLTEKAMNQAGSAGGNQLKVADIA